MADQNRLPDEQRDNVNANEDMHDGEGSSQGTAPGAGDGPAPGTYGPQGGTVAGGDTSGAPLPGDQ